MTASYLFRLPSWAEATPRTTHSVPRLHRVSEKDRPPTPNDNGSCGRRPHIRVGRTSSSRVKPRRSASNPQPLRNPPLSSERFIDKAVRVDCEPSPASPVVPPRHCSWTGGLFDFSLCVESDRPRSNFKRYLIRRFPKICRVGTDSRHIVIIVIFVSFRYHSY